MGHIITIFLILLGFCAPAEGNIKGEENFSIFCKSCIEDEIDVEKEIREEFMEEPVYVSLDECIATALLNNYNIKVSNAEYKSAKWEYRNALAQFLPDVNFQGYATYYKGQVLVGGVVPTDVKELALSGTVVASHDLTRGGEQIFRAKSMKLRARANLKNSDYTKDRMILETAIGYYEVLRAKISVEIQLKNLYERTAQLKLTQTLKEAGLGTRFDVVRSKSEQALAEQNLKNALSNFRTRQAKLANLMGIEVETHLFPIEFEVEPYTLINEKETPEGLIETAKVSRDDIKRQQDGILAMKQEKYGILTEFIPNARVVYEGQVQGTARVGMYPNNNIGVYVDIPIGSRLGAGTITKAKALQEKINAEINSLEQLIRDIKEDIISNFYSAKILKDRIEIAKRQVDYALESVKLAELRLDSGEGILIDVIQAQTIKNNARIELLSTIVDYNIAQIRLLFDCGRISYDNIINKYNP